MARQKITPCLWFDGKAEEAARFYVSLFPDSEITGITPGPTGAALVVQFRLAGQEFLALNGGPAVHVQRGDLALDRLPLAGRARRAVGEALGRRVGGPVRVAQGPVRPLVAARARRAPEAPLRPRPARAGRVMEAMMGMTRLDIRALEDAAGGKP